MPLRGEEIFPIARDDCETCGILELDRLAALFMDNALRETVCRISRENLTPSDLGRAIGMPEGQVMRRIHTLRGWGLVRLVRRDSATSIVEPLPGAGERTLERWANKYCAHSDVCGASETVPEPRETGRAERAMGVGINGGGSLSGKLVTVFGGTGFLGRELVQHLVKAGARVRVAARHPNSATDLLTLGGKGQVELVTADIAVVTTLDGMRIKKDPLVLTNFGNDEQIDRAIDGADMVVNVAGIHKEVGSQTFSAVHFHGARKIARATAEAKIPRLVLVSSISSEADSPSLYAQSKAIAEANVRGHYPSVTVVRPSVVFGPEDRFVNRLASLFRYAPFIPLYGGGEVRYQPVYVSDVSAAIVRILEDPETQGRTYELGGPRAMTMREMFSVVATVSGQRRPLVPLPMWIAEIQASVLGLLPNPPLTRDQLILLGRDNLVDPQALGFADLGITPTAFEDVAPKYLGKNRRVSKFAPAY